MKYLAIDYGQKRVGLAISTSDEKLILPYKTLTYTSRKKLVSDITSIVATENIQRIVIGLPIGINGEETLITRQVKNLVRDLKKKLDVPVDLVDESYSSYNADRTLKNRGMSAKKIKKVIDQQAAVDILNTYFSSKNP
ncbi:Holliday junction resolvase RuvX [Desulfothermus naphthae]